jgi:uncharacterized protein YndB with AHSA1/START domain
MAGLDHDTFTIERPYPQPPDRVYHAFATPELKRRWYADGGAHDVVRYDLDFAVGGQEVLVGRMKAGTPVAGATLTWTNAFLALAPGARVVFSQTLDVGDRRISCALVTAEFFPDGTGTRLRLTHQAVFFEGADGPGLRRQGWVALLDAVAGVLA